MTRLGTRSPSCSGFEAEPLCWLQHSEQVAARLAQPGKLVLWRPACNRTGEEQPGEGGGRRRTEEEGLRGADPPLGSPGPATPRTGLCFSPTGISCVHNAPSVPGTQEPSETLRAHRLAGLLPQRRSQDTCLPLHPDARISWPAHLSGLHHWAAWHRGHQSTWGEGGTWASQVGSQLREWQARLSRSVWMRALSTRWVSCDLAGSWLAP